MNHVAGIPKLQLQMSSLEDSISQENPVRFVDLFVEQLDLIKLGFEVKTLKKEGRPSFEYSTLLKIYLYGYLNGLRSSRRLESECCRNIELHWLTLGLIPNYHTISDFRKDNPNALKNVFKLFVVFLKDIDLIGGHKIKRCFTILSLPDLTEKLKNWVSPYKKNPNSFQKWLNLRLLELVNFYESILPLKNRCSYSF